MLNYNSGTAALTDILQAPGVQQGAYPGTGGPAAATPGAQAPGTPGPPSTLSAPDNPDLQYALDKMKGRFEGDGGAGMAIDLAGGKLREASEGERNAAAGRRARMGTSGSGIEGYDDRKISDKYQSNLAGAASDIALQREKEKDQIIRDVANTGASKAAISGAERDRQLALYNSQEANRRAQESAGLGQTQAILDMLSRLDVSKLGGSLGTASALGGPPPKGALAVR